MQRRGRAWQGLRQGVGLDCIGEPNYGPLGLCQHPTVRLQRVCSTVWRALTGMLTNRRTIDPLCTRR